VPEPLRFCPDEQITRLAPFRRICAGGRVREITLPNQKTVQQGDFRSGWSGRSGNQAAVAPVSHEADAREANQQHRPDRGLWDALDKVKIKLCFD
jgi:hypothetical protein